MTDAKLGRAHIFIINALTILGQTGGSIVCTPGQHLRWKVHNEDISCNSVDLTRACKMFVDDWEKGDQL